MNEATQSGIPLKERDPDVVRATLQKACSDPDVAEIFVRLHAYAREKHLGLSALVEQTGISQPVLSPCFNGTYTGNYAQTAEKISAFFYRLEQKELYGDKHEFVHTRLAKSLNAIYERTRAIRRIQMIHSPEQVGKSWAAKAYTAANNSGRTVRVELSGGMTGGAQDFVWLLSELFDIGYTIKYREKLMRIRNKLASCDLVIVDEAHLIEKWPINSQAKFWDYLRTDIFQNGERGVVMQWTNCNPMEALQRFRQATKYNLGQLLGRMRLDTIYIDPAEDICPQDVRALVSRFYEPGEQVVSALTEMARRPQLGHFGLLDDVMNQAWFAAKLQGKDRPTDAIVKSCIEEIRAQLKEHQSLFDRRVN